MNKQRKVLITTTYNEMGIIIDTKTEEVQPATDTISRADAIALAEEIETKRLKGEIDLTYAPMIKGIMAFPPAEPQIIRCNDCKHWDFSDIHSSICPNRRCKAIIGKLYTDADFYCAYAERREDG